ncbi:endonuclease/exonuclease/phosphatase family protein [Microbulbifer sp. TRSA005]|uniref:endonuclease/exonuclease/phosphatase family protein n=1 Tax=Microbulbifer sp. TRSA005 TaxID=3243383 RepID=UPI00403980D1
MRKIQSLLFPFVLITLSLSAVSLQAASFKVVSHNVWSGFTSFYDLNVDEKPENPFKLSCADDYYKYRGRFEAYLNYLSEEVVKDEDFIIAFQEMDNKTKRACGDKFSLTQEIDEYFSPGVENRFLGLVPMDGGKGYDNSQSHGAAAGVYNGNAIVTSPNVLDTKYKTVREVERVDGSKFLRGYIATLLEIEPGKQLWFVNIHATHHDTDKNLAVDDARKMLTEMKVVYEETPRPIIFAGDFNIKFGTEYYDQLIDLFEKHFEGTIEATQPINKTYHYKIKDSVGGGNTLKDSHKIDYIFYYSPGGQIKQKVLPAGALNKHPIPVMSAGAKDALCIDGECFPDHKLIYAEFYWP